MDNYHQMTERSLGQRSDTLEERGLLKSWRQDLSSSPVHVRNQSDHPNYWAQQPSSLISTSNITSLNIGTGASIYESLRPTLETVSHELIIVTCFWARSETQTNVASILRTLSAKGQRSGHKIRVRIYFSSCSLWQKIFHTFSRDGKIYAPESWPSTFGLPTTEELAGLDLQIKSVFFLPFSVMHPKFIILDRKHVFLPSCNISWEDWFEGCVGMTGPIVDQFITFWLRFWATPGDRAAHFPYNDASETGDFELGSDTAASDDHDSHEQGSSLPIAKSLQLTNIKTIFLPSPHHINPLFRFPWQDPAPPPPTPLNTFLLRAIATASSSIYIQTPNLTSAPVISALLDAVTRGVSLHIITSERLMVLEQLVLSLIHI